MEGYAAYEPPGSSLEALLQTPQDLSERALAARYAPIILFDRREPFFPLAAGYTIFRTDAESPSFARRIELRPPGKPPADFAIEYAIWWDRDIGHLYELEHAWVYVDENHRVVRAEASWHGGFNDMATDGELPLIDGRIRLFSEPGKHAFAPVADWLMNRADHTRRSCGRKAGAGGVHVTPLFEGIIRAKTPMADRLVHTYLERHAFEPSFDFSRTFAVAPQSLVPWPALSKWIPRRVGWWVEELERTIPPAERRILRIAHRGASAHAPENTLAAIAKAAELGADMVELDVQVTADGVPVIIHDADLSRTTNGHGRVSEYRLAQLKQLDAGNGEQIPTLDEAIRGCLDYDLGLYLEVKSGRSVPKMVDILRQQQAEHQTIVGSFRPDWLADVRALAPQLPTAVLFGSAHVNPVALASAVRAQYVHPAWEGRDPEPHKLLADTWIAQVRAAGLGIICWHEERPAEIAALRQLGVDGICSDAPEQLL